ncbi:hypothetical protein SLEP1_g19769 [Rubroshorea leprosula]|uniref:Scarecrow-like protein 30 n=1 Tax=Rubroshorea leprosula TaxID=152421 RepID=A0AAV5J9C2_9ROSI|nr:hypothetical protein SLEP1_g19769 [Rubroshorea leprosula]
MDTLLHDLPTSIHGFGFDNGSAPVYSNHNLVSGLNPNRTTVPLPPPNQDSPPSAMDPAPSFGMNPDEHPDNSPYASLVLNYINEMLMEEDMEEKTCMLQDCLALQAAEKSFYEVLVHKNPQSPEHRPPSVCQIAEESDDNISSSKISSSSSSLVDSLEKTSLVSDSGSNSSLNFSGSPNTPESTPSKSRERKNYEREDGDYSQEGRSNKHPAFSLEDPEQSEMFDDVLLCQGENHDCRSLSVHGNGKSKNKGINTGGNRRRKNSNQEEVVDLWSLLTQCAQSVSINDQRTATELLKQIRQHSSDLGDGTQRLAHYFANGLETRLAGQRAPVYSPLVSNRTSAADILKAYRVFVLACPFKKMSNFYANKTIVKLAQKATTLHIIDIGICYGFQWPCLIQRLSERAGGPPKLRITGVEFPQPGFRPSERVEETGRRLNRYCERFNVPFEYNVIAKKWETIQLEELKLGKNELLAVNSMYRLKNLPDDTVVSKSARDAVLKLIKDSKPDLFIQGVVNGTYNAPFFVTRFREALFHFSALFDMFEANVSREDQQRMMFEKEIYGKDIMNVIACEGIERVERPETYRQWQSRNLRAGFKQVGLDQELLKTVRTMVKSSYHNDFDIDVDGNWMLQGWKGRVIHALSCWKPA